MSAGDRGDDAAHAGTLPGPGIGDAPTHADPRVVAAQAQTLPAPEAGPHAPTLQGPHTVADLPSLQPVAEQSYSIGDEIARGGMGKILSARDRRLRREVVIKVTRHGQIDPRFAREALITARLQHPSIVRVYEAGVLADGRAFYAMERVRGRSLEVILDETTQLQDRLALLPHAIAVADAIAYAHSEGVIHRDLKPSNVLIGPFGETVVIDWGLAKDLRAPAADEPGAASTDPGTSSDGSLTQVGAVMGTPSYMAPEQARGDASDERTDVYALGALLYALLAGVPPHRGDTTDEVLEGVIAGRRAPLAERAPGVPPELATIVERAMARDPAARYPSAKQLADELRQFAAGKLVASHAYSPWRLVRRWLRRHAAPLGIGAVAVVALVATAVVSYLQVRKERDDANEARAIADLRKEEATNKKDNTFYAVAQRALVGDPSLAATWIRELSDTALAWPKTLELASEAARRGLALELRGHTGDVDVIVAHPSGRLIASAGADGTVRLWTFGGRPQVILKGHVGPVETLELSPDGTVLASGGTDGNIFLWDVERGTRRELAGHRDTVRDLAFSADGKRLASASEDRTLWLWDVAEARGAPLVQHTHGLRPVAWVGDTLVAGGFDGALVFVDPATKQRRVVRVSDSELRTLALSPDGSTIVTGDENGVAAMWSTSGQRISTLPGVHTDVVREVRYSPDGRYLVTAGGNGVIYVYTTIGGFTTTALRGNEDGVKDIDISEDGRWIASAGLDGAVRIWPITGGEPRTFVGHGTAIKAVTFVGTDRVVSGAEDDRMRVWRLDDPGTPPPGPPMRAWLAERTNVEMIAPRSVHAH